MCTVQFDKQNEKKSEIGYQLARKMSHTYDSYDMSMQTY